MKENDKKAGASLVPRPPVVVVMGHIDHGKSTLLDYIRKANTAEKEIGGITQRISAYEAEVSIDDGQSQGAAGQESKQRNKEKITFLDTPGHEAFCAARSQGAKVADIAVLVVSAEDGVKPQTLEALARIEEGSMPFIVAVNKIDKPGANIDKTKQDLAEHNILVEGWGGTVPVCAISAKTGQGVNELLELISLQSTLEEFKADPAVPAEGFIIDNSLDQKRGNSATLVIKNGTLRVGMYVAVPGAFAPIRAIENYKGDHIEEASFSSPVRIFGWNALPSLCSPFKTFLKKEGAVDFSLRSALQSQTTDEQNGSTAETFLEVVAKADTFGSLEAVEYELKKLGNEKIRVKVISKGVGTITENDIKTASIKKGLVLGFNVEPDRSAAALALREKVEIKTYRIIYELVDYVKEKLAENTPVETSEVVTGSAKILKVFSQNKDKQVVGGKVAEGEIKSADTVQIHRREALVGSGKIKELQIQKIKTGSAKEGQEFGLMIESKIEIAPGDVLKATTLVQR